MVKQASDVSKKAEKPCVGFITAPSLDVARTLANQLLEHEEIACANLIPGIESIYRWEGKVQADQEVLMMIKTMVSAQSRVIEIIEREHPYDVPECIFLDIGDGHLPYLSWLQKEVRKA